MPKEFKRTVETFPEITKQTKGAGRGSKGARPNVDIGDSWADLMYSHRG